MQKVVALVAIVVACYFVGTSVVQMNGAATALTANQPATAPSPVLWVSLVAAGALIATAGAYRIRQVRSLARHAR